MSSGLREAVIELREADALWITEEQLQGGTDPLEIVSACREAMDVIGQRFAEGDAEDVAGGGKAGRLHEGPVRSVGVPHLEQRVHEAHLKSAADAASEKLLYG